MPAFPAYGLKPYYDALKAWLTTSLNEDGTLRESALPANVATVNTPGAEGEVLTVVGGTADWAPGVSQQDIEDAAAAAVPPAVEDYLLDNPPSGGGGIVDTMTTSQSLRGSPTGPYIAPSAMTLPEDFGLVKKNGGSLEEDEDYATEVTAAINAAVQQAKDGGRISMRGGTVGLMHGSYYINAPIVLPRTGHPVTNVVHLVGNSDRTTVLRGANSFPAGRGMVEWEQVAKKAWNQRIDRIFFWMPDVPNTKAIYAKFVGGDPDQQTFLAHDVERFIIEITNCDFASNNAYHEASIDIELSTFASYFHNLVHDPLQWYNGNNREGYSTVLIKTPTLIQGDTPFPTWDAPGIAHSYFSLIRNGYRGGMGGLFHGRLINCLWDGALSNSGLPGDTDMSLINSVGTTLRNVSLEGRSSRKVYMQNCHNVKLEQVHLGTPLATPPKWAPSTWYGLGADVVDKDWGAASNTNHDVWTATVAGTSGASEPTWSGDTVTDGGVTWTRGERAAGDGIVMEGCHHCVIDDRLALDIKPPYSRYGAKILKIDAGCINTRINNFQIEPLDGPLTDEYEDFGIDTQLDIVTATTVGPVVLPEPELLLTPDETRDGTGAVTVTPTGTTITDTDAWTVMSATTNYYPDPIGGAGLTGWWNGGDFSGGRITTWDTTIGHTINGVATGGSYRITNEHTTHYNSGFSMSRSKAYTLPAAGTYTMSAWVYVPSSFTGQGFKVSVINLAGATGTMDATVNMSLRDQWQKVTAGPFTAVSGDLAGYIDVVTTGMWNVGDYANFIGFQVEPGSVATPTIAGGLGTGYAWTGTANASSSTRTAGTLTVPYTGTPSTLLVRRRSGGTVTTQNVTVSGGVGTSGNATFTFGGSTLTVASTSSAEIIGAVMYSTELTPAQIGKASGIDPWTWAALT